MKEFQNEHICLSSTTDSLFMYNLNLILSGFNLILSDFNLILSS